MTLAHIEEALDRLSVAMLQMAHVVAATPDRESGAGSDEIGAEARALCFHLRKVSEQLGDPQDSCQAARKWVRRLRDSSSHGPDVERPAA